MPRKRSWLAAAAVVVAVGASATFVMHADAAVPGAPAGMSRVFADDFAGAAGTGLNRADWLYDIGTGYPGGASGWGTGEVERMTDSTANVYQDGSGHLVIKPIRDGAGNWTSGRVETQRTDFAAPAGGKVRMEARIQQPNVSGAAAAGYWPAFWALGAAARPVGATNWPSIGEWDIMEDINGRSSVFSTLHCGVASGGVCNETTGLGSGEHACAGCQTGFHTYAVEYDRSVSPEQLRFYLDGSNYFTLNSTQIDATTWNNATHHGMFVILNVAIGGGFPGAFGGGPTGSTQSGVPMLVDYVAVYQSGGGTTTAPTTGGCTGLAGWNSSAVYVGGNAVSYNGHKYTAKWWTQGETPGQADVWADNGACSGGATTVPTTAPTTAPTTKAPTTNPTTQPPSGSTTWAAYTAYAVGQVVTYNGMSYRCLQGHTSLPGWEPPNVAALWQKI